jgi:hypothetical protein
MEKREQDGRNFTIPISKECFQEYPSSKKKTRKRFKKIRERESCKRLRIDR